MERFAAFGESSGVLQVGLSVPTDAWETLAKRGCLGTVQNPVQDRERCPIANNNNDSNKYYKYDYYYYYYHISAVAPASLCWELRGRQIWLSEPNMDPITVINIILL